jgi:hypothetical protein
VVAWFVLAAVFATCLAQINVPTFLRLIQHGARATAMIVQLDCDNHGQASYTFNIGSTDYSSRGIMWINCRSLRPGDSIQIYYDTTDPNVSRTAEPLAGLKNELIPIAIGCLVFPPLIIFSFARYWKRRAKPAS